MFVWLLSLSLGSAIESENLKCAKCKNNYATRCAALFVSVYVSVFLRLLVCSPFLHVSLCVFADDETWSQSCLQHTKEKAKAFTICCHTFNIYNYQTNTAAGYLLFSIQLMQTLQNLVSIFPSGYPFFSRCLSLPLSLSVSPNSCNPSMCMWAHTYILTKCTKKLKARKRQIQTQFCIQPKPEPVLNLKHKTNLQGFAPLLESDSDMMCVAMLYCFSAVREHEAK